MKTLLPVSVSCRVAALACVLMALCRSVLPDLAGSETPLLPTIYAFNVAAEATIPLGTTTSLNWSVGDATTLSLSPGFGVVSGTSISITPTVTTTYTLTATNSNGSVFKTKKITVVPPPVIDSFSAAPASIAAGASTTLNWAAHAASSYSMAANVGGVNSTVSGNSLEVRPTQSTTYTLVARNLAGTDTRNVTVTVTAPLPKPTISSFTATPTSVVTGSATTLAWSVSDATSLSISPGTGPVTGSSVTVVPTASTTYTLTATNASGSRTKKVTVTVTAPVPAINSFTASPASVTMGSSATLAWSVGNAASLSISPGVGAVTGSSVVVQPTSTTTYSLTATNAFGQSTKSTAVTVTVPAAPVIGAFTATPPFITAGATSTLSWTISGANSVAITADAGPSPGPVTGSSVVVNPAATTLYTLKATNAVGTSTAVIPVTVFNPGTGGVEHPRIWVTPASLASLATRAAANDPAWIKLRNACDTWATMPIAPADQPPSSGTINGGYQYLDYLRPSTELALGYLVAKTVDPVRAAKYAAKERQLLLALSDPVHHGRPTTDSGYSIRAYVPALALGYDWIFETLGDADRAQIYTEINRWVTSFDQSGFGRNFPQGNYFAGYYCAKALGALATEGENPAAPAMWNDWLNRLHYGLVQPYHAQWLSGGGAPDGWNYGPFETINMIRPIAAALTAKGLDLIHDAKPFTYLDGHARWMTQFTWPDMKTVSDRGFVYEGDNPTPASAGWATQYNGLLRLAKGSNAPLMQRYTLDLRATQGSGDAEPWAEFLFHDPAAPAADYRTALSYQTPGDGQVAMRSAWSTNAVSASFQAGPYTGFPDSAEEFFDEGALAIQRGDVPLLVNAWGALMRHTPGTSDGDGAFDAAYNELFGDQVDGVHAGRRLFNTYYAARPSGYYGQIGNGPSDSNTTLSRFEEGGSFTLMRGTHLESQYLDDHPITGWTRTVVYVRPQLFVVYDRTSLNSASVDNWMAWHVASTPLEQTGASAGTHRFDVNDPRAAFGGNLFRGRVTTVLPAGQTVKTVDVFNRHKVYRLEVRPAVPVAAATWLTVFDAAASASSAGNVAPLTAAAGNVLSGTVEGTLISGTAGGNTAVLFGTTGNPVQGTIRVLLPAAQTYCLATDLVPNAGYAVTTALSGGSLTLQLAAGGTFTATGQGTLPLSISASGVVATP